MTAYRTALPIRGIDSERLRTVASDLHAIFDRDLAAVEKNARDLLTEIGSLVSDLDRALGRVTTSELTAQKLAKDEERDNLYLFIAETIRTHTRHFNPELKAAADRLEAELDKRESGFQSAGYDENTAELNLLFADLDQASAQSDLETLGLTEWYANLKQANSEFETLQRTTSDSPDLPLVSRTKTRLRYVFGLLLRLGDYYARQDIAPWTTLMATTTQRIRILTRPGVSGSPEAETQTVEA